MSFTHSGELLISHTPRWVTRAAIQFLVQLRIPGAKVRSQYQKRCFLCLFFGHSLSFLWSFMREHNQRRTLVQSCTVSTKIIFFSPAPTIIVIQKHDIQRVWKTPGNEKAAWNLSLGRSPGGSSGGEAALIGWTIPGTDDDNSWWGIVLIKINDYLFSIIFND